MHRCSYPNEATDGHFYGTTTDTRDFYGTTSEGGANITTSVPAGATTGEVKVTTPLGTLSTRDVSFRVLP